MRITVLRFALAGVAFLGIARSSSAQTQYVLGGPATWTWRASLDGGQSWATSLVEAPQSQASVIIQALVAFPAEPTRYLGIVALDGTISGVGGAGPLDTVSDIFRGALYNVPQAAALRFGNVIKVDFIWDTQPPGEGPWWFFIGQPAPGLGAVLFDNPLFVMQYTLNLDGSPGDREIGGVWRRFVQFPDGDYAYTHSFLQPDVITAHPLTHEPLTIHVLPAPGAWALGLAALTRRRGTPCVPSAGSLSQRGAVEFGSQGEPRSGPRGIPAPSSWRTAEARR